MNLIYPCQIYRLKSLNSIHLLLLLKTKDESLTHSHMADICYRAQRRPTQTSKSWRSTQKTGGLFDFFSSFSKKSEPKYLTIPTSKAKALFPEHSQSDLQTLPSTSTEASSKGTPRSLPSALKSTETARSPGCSPK